MPSRSLGVVLCLLATFNQNLGMGIQKLYLNRNPSIPYYKIQGWWLAMALFISGVILDFVALSFIPACVALPIGSIGLAVSAGYAAMYLGESFTRRDTLGTIAVIMGSWVAVIFSGSDDHTIDVPEFISMIMPGSPQATYLSICLVATVLVAVLHTARPSQLLAAALPGAIGMFGNVLGKLVAGWAYLSLTGSSQIGYPAAWVTVILTVVVLVLQNHLLQGALRQADNVVVVPVYYVVICISSCLSGIFFFEEFTATSTRQDLTFMGGVAVVCWGCWLLAGGRKDVEKDLLLPQPFSSPQSSDCKHMEADAPRSPIYTPLLDATALSPRTIQDILTRRVRE
eukprot:gnl/Dysnectes_brevis/6910_a11107_302.p2 GENE.gnl/Dysnectes_brevis/6910_a11107_302~~gnl/Dysnectes_brevis/6910_a11107_302.p2  ORF type:complete len:341 (-),score=94.29 gnl/Dysnectes_brevis/6910_a11107_302:72-1094(-)